MRVDAAIIGAGASGLVAAINLARQGKSIVLIEAQKRGAKKILASGNGKCNITNRKISSKNFYAKNQKLISSLLQKCNTKRVIEFFKSIGLEVECIDDGRCFPKAFDAKVVLELLEAQIRLLDIKSYYEVKDLKVNRDLSLEFNDLKIYPKNLIIATGSNAAPQLGGSRFALNLAKNFGHNIIKPLPALVPLLSKDRICKSLNGLKLNVEAKLFIDNKEISKISDDLLFREYGVSGLLVLDLSIKAVRAIDMGKKVEIVIDFLKDFNKKEALIFLKSRVDKKRSLTFYLWLCGFLHSKLANYIASNLKIKSEKELNANNLKELVEFLKNYRVKIEGFREFKYAEVALGGVNSNEIDLNFESKKKKGLYFIGEALDVAGDRGGYNFTFAWCSALSLKF